MHKPHPISVSDMSNMEISALLRESDEHGPLTIKNHSPIEGSIAKWKRVYTELTKCPPGTTKAGNNEFLENLREFANTWRTCSCCSHHFNSDRSCNGQGGCPIKAYTGSSCCYNTPYQETLAAFDKYYELRDTDSFAALVKLVIEELDFLNKVWATTKEDNEEWLPPSATYLVLKRGPIDKRSYILATRDTFTGTANAEAWIRTNLDMESDRPIIVLVAGGNHILPHFKAQENKS